MDIIDALIVAHGQPCSPDAAELSLAEYAARIGTRLAPMRISSATMAAPGRLEQRLARLSPGGLIYPLFMADGWFVRTALAKRIGDLPVAVMAPLGMDPALPGLVARGLAGQRGAESSLLLAAHGSANGRTAPERSARDFARALVAHRPGMTVEVGFLEQRPSLGEALQNVELDAACLPFFAMEGNHVRQDVCDELSQAGFAGRILPVISEFPGVETMIARAIQRELQGKATQARI